MWSALNKRDSKPSLCDDGDENYSDPGDGVEPCVGGDGVDGGDGFGDRTE